VLSLKSIIDYRDSLIVGASGHPSLGGSVADWAGRLLDSYNTDRQFRPSGDAAVRITPSIAPAA